MFKDYFGNDITKDVITKLEDVFPDFINFRVGEMYAKSHLGFDYHVPGCE